MANIQDKKQKPPIIFMQNTILSIFLLNSNETVKINFGTSTSPKGHKIGISASLILYQCDTVQILKFKVVIFIHQITTNLPLIKMISLPTLSFQGEGHVVLLYSCCLSHRTRKWRDCRLESFFSFPQRLVCMDDPSTLTGIRTTHRTC